MANDGWDSGEDTAYSAPVQQTTTFTRGGGGRGRGQGGRGGGRRWDERSNDSSEGNWRDRDNNRDQSNSRGRGGGRGGRGGGGGGGRGGRGGYERDDNDSTVMTINSSDVGRVIGKGGAKIRELESDSGAEIKVSLSKYAVMLWYGVLYFKNVFLYLYFQFIRQAAPK